MYKDKASNERFGDIQMQIYRPNIGMLSRSEKLSDMRTKNDKVRWRQFHSEIMRDFFKFSGTHSKELRKYKD